MPVIKQMTCTLICICSNGSVSELEIVVKCMTLLVRIWKVRVLYLGTAVLIFLVTFLSLARQIQYNNLKIRHSIIVPRPFDFIFSIYSTI
jgi:hypothetical protein